LKKPLILVTNDDGIMAPGLRALIKTMHELGEVVVVAPDKPQSGMGHAITVSSPLRLEQFLSNNEHVEYTCNGTPVDCVKLAIDKVIKGKPDLLVSGINHGSNATINVIYSGTMSAALEGAIEQIPSIGFSYLSHSFKANLSVAVKYAKIIAKMVLEKGLPAQTCLNVNIPAVAMKEIKGIRICRQAKAFWSDEYFERLDPNHRKYYWLTGVLENKDKGQDTDEWALKNNYVSIVPVQADLTAHESIKTLKRWKFPDNG
jgi:5'-nucleotidase